MDSPLFINRILTVFRLKPDYKQSVKLVEMTVTFLVYKFFPDS